MIRLTEERFKQSLIESVEEASAGETGEQTEQPAASDSKDGDADERIDRQSIEAMDLEHDEMLDRAIEFLTRPAKQQKIAA